MSRVGSFDPLDQPRHDGELPDGVSSLGVPTERTGHNAFILSAAAVVALLALIFTLSWVVYHQLSPDDDQQQRPGRPTQGQSTPLTPTVQPTLD